MNICGYGIVARITFRHEGFTIEAAELGLADARRIFQVTRAIVSVSGRGPSKQEPS